MSLNPPSHLFDRPNKVKSIIKITLFSNITFLLSCNFFTLGSKYVIFCSYVYTHVLPEYKKVSYSFLLVKNVPKNLAEFEVTVYNFIKCWF